MSTHGRNPLAGLGNRAVILEGGRITGDTGAGTRPEQVLAAAGGEDPGGEK